MDIKQMIYFKTIVEEGTISKAAQSLHISQPPSFYSIKTIRRRIKYSITKKRASSSRTYKCWKDFL